ncbi:MAG: hypothetical protein PHC82_03900 [Candidatus Pacebacteria bacterium]|nr:hypothetical protein [Candidatus Paceibacterota bacterium]
MCNFFKKKEPDFLEIIYYDEGVEEASYRLGFDLVQKKWIRQVNSCFHRGFEATKYFTEEARLALLKEHGLLDREKDFPAKRLERMTPKELRMESMARTVTAV